MLAIGLMSGTSFDGIDCSLIETDGIDLIKSIANFYFPYPKEFQIKLNNLLTDYSSWLYIEKELTHYHSICVNEIIKQSSLLNKDIEIIGFHGQTIVHCPSSSLTWQIGNPHQLSSFCNIDVINDFRRRDIAKGGEGAPLIPIFHQCLVKNHQFAVAVLNIGGVSNITFSDKDILIAFDVGPGNALINDAMMQYYNKIYDDQGNLARSGNINYDIVNTILETMFFKKLPPKSLDRNTFKEYDILFRDLNPPDTVSTLTYLTAKSIALSFKFLPSIPSIIYASGGGIKNLYLIELLKKEFSLLPLSPQLKNISSLGIDPDFVESQGFAFLAARYLKSLRSSYPSTTSTTAPTLAGVLVKV